MVEALYDDSEGTVAKGYEKKGLSGDRGLPRRLDLLYLLHDLLEVAHEREQLFLGDCCTTGRIRGHGSSEIAPEFVCPIGQYLVAQGHAKYADCECDDDVYQIGIIHNCV